MEIKNNEKLFDSLIINKVPSNAVFNQMIKEGKVNDDELYLIAENENFYHKFTFTAINNQSSFTIPFDYEDSKTLNVFYNGILMTNNINYKIIDKKIQLIDFTANTDDIITVMGIEGPISIDITEQVDAINSGLDKIITRTQQSLNTLSSATIAFEDELKGTKEGCLQEITYLGDTYCQDLDERISKIPTDMSQALYKDSKNTMLNGSSITMYNNYTPTADMDVSTKKYVDTAIENNKLPTTVVQSDITNTFTTGKITMATSYTPTADGDLIDKKYLDAQIKKAVPAFSNGPLIIESSKTFVPSEYGIAVGDKVQVICIGGGAGGGNTGDGDGPDAAGESSVGGDYGCGGNGATPNATRYQYGGGGGSGYLVKQEVTITSNSIIVTIGAGGGKAAGGGTTSFGTYFSASGGSPGGYGGTSFGREGAGGHPGTGNRGGAGWTVKSYSLTDSSGTLNKGSGAVFIWY